jgi:hypothetical protein
MTFFEAAVEVLRRSGRPLHYKKITEIAISEDLLSHVGKTPQATMSDRLEREVRKNNGSPIDQTRPGVYKLDEEYAKELTAKVRKREEEERKKREERQKKQQQQQQEQQTRDDSSDQQSGSQQSASEQSGGDSGRRRARGADSGGHAKRKRDSSTSEESTPKRRRRPSKTDDDSDEKQRQSEPSSAPSRRRPSGGEGGEAAEVDVSQTAHLEEGPVKLRGIARAARTVLNDGAREPMHIEELSDEIFDRKLVKFHTHDAITTVKSALANDNQIREQRGHRPLFAQDDEGYWWLTEWNLSAEIFQKEQAILSLSEEIRQDSVRQLGSALMDVKTEALEHLALTLLERLGYHNIKVSKRSADGDVFFTADWRQGLADVRVCVRVVSDHDWSLDDGAVHDLRETLNHYSASEGVIIHLGEVTDEAVKASRREGESPITLLDKQTFVELLIKHGIGVKVYDNPIVTVDMDFIDALKT